MKKIREKNAKKIGEKNVMDQSDFRMWSATKTCQTTMNRRSEAAIVVQKCLRENKAATTIQVKICTKYRKHCKSYVSFHQIGLFLSKAKV